MSSRAPASPAPASPAPAPPPAPPSFEAGDVPLQASAHPSTPASNAASGRTPVIIRGEVMGPSRRGPMVPVRLLGPGQEQQLAELEVGLGRQLRVLVFHRVAVGAVELDPLLARPPDEALHEVGGAAQAAVGAGPGHRRLAE